MTFPTGTAPARETPLSRKLAAQAKAAPLTVGHRGAAATHPENTLPSFQAALDAGAPIVELDFHQTADGVPVCLHDATLERTTDADAVFGRNGVQVAELVRDDLDGLDAGSWKDARFAGTRVPTLEQALALIQPRATTMVEHKAGDAAILVALLRRLGALDGVIVQSFDWSWLEQVHRLEPRITIAALGDGDLTARHLQTVGRTGASMAHWNRATLRAADVDELRARGYLTCLYTVNDDFGLVGAGALGIDAIGTDDPANLRALIAQGRVRKP
jgi:glycerophosphoryl diester phosphodiesterase